MNKYTLFIIVMLDSICAFAQMESSTSRFEDMAVDSLKNRISPLLPTHHIPGHFQTLQPDFSTSDLKFLRFTKSCAVDLKKQQSCRKNTRRSTCCNEAQLFRRCQPYRISNLTLSLTEVNHI